MALPVIKSLAECANWTETVEPYTYQLRPLPQILFESATNPVALKQIYLDTNPLISAFAFALAAAPIFLIVAEINRNYSQVDRFWSIIPTIYNVHYAVWAHLSGLRAERVYLIAFVSALWSIRLTFNYWRRGGYSIGSEDYRWLIVKNYVGQPWFFLFDVVFIAYIQMILLFSITTPTYVVLLTTRIATVQNKIGLDKSDLLLATIMVGFIALSAVADQQQWNFHAAKTIYKRTLVAPTGWEGEELERGFRSSGLFAVARHPNFAAEQSVWVTLHAWACVSSDSPFNWTGVGALAYLCLFQASTWLTELLSAQKYPAYKEYQEQVGKFFPITGAQPPVFSSSKKTKSVTNGSSPDVDAAKARQRYNLR